MNMEHEIKRLTDNLAPPATAAILEKLRASPANAASQYTPPAPPRPSGGTVLEALAKLEEHAQRILADARALESELCGHNGEPFQPEDGQRPGGGIWDRLAGQIVMIERVFAQIDDANHISRGSLK